MKMSFDKKYYKQYEREFNNIHESAPVTYQTFKINGEKYFQMDYYSKNVNICEIGPLIQSKHKLQFDKKTAKEFINLLIKELEL